MSKRTPVIFLFLLLLFLPNILLYFGITASLTLGILIYCVFVFLFTLIFFRKYFYFKKNNLIAYFFIIFFLCSHALFIIMILDKIDYEKFIGSLIVLLFIFLSSELLSNIFSKSEEGVVENSIKVIYWMIFFIGLISILGFKVESAKSTLKSAFPFAEPSHLALFVAPFFIYLVVISKDWKKYFYFLSFFALSLLMENLTMIVICLFAILIFIKMKSLMILSPIIIGSFFYLDHSYYSDRLIFSETENLSALVYIQGWDFMQKSLSYTNGGGLGFQQLGFFDTYGDSSEKIFLILGEYLNIFDGGFVLSKIFSEFGLFSLLLVFPFFIFFVKMYFSLKNISNNRNSCSEIQIFSMGCIFCYAINLLVRGVGYFDPSMVLLLVSIMILKDTRRKAGFAA